MSAHQICLALARRFSGQSWVSSTEIELVLPRVEGRGYPIRRFDFIAANANAGRSWTVVGAEVKVSRADFLAEMKDPAKFQALRDRVHCAYFATPKGLIKPDELPDGAGLLVLQDDGRLREVKKPARNDNPDAAHVLAGIIRRSGTPRHLDVLRSIHRALGLPDVGDKVMSNPDWWTARLERAIAKRAQARLASSDGAIEAARYLLESAGYQVSCVPVRPPRP